MSFLTRMLQFLYMVFTNYLEWKKIDRQEVHDNEKQQKTNKFESN